MTFYAVQEAGGVEALVLRIDEGIDSGEANGCAALYSLAKFSALRTYIADSKNCILVLANVLKNGISNAGKSNADAVLAVLGSEHSDIQELISSAKNTKYCSVPTCRKGGRCICMCLCLRVARTRALFTNPFPYSFICRGTRPLRALSRNLLL